MEISMEFLQKLKIELPYDPAMLLVDIYPKQYATGTFAPPCCTTSKSQETEPA